MNTGWWEIDIHGCYSLVKIAFAPICTCKNNRRIWRHNASDSRSHDVTDQLWWHHNVKSEKTVLSNNGEMIVCSRTVCSRYEIACKNITIHSSPWITIFWSLVRWFANDFHSWLRHSWKSLANHPPRDQKIVIHGNSCIILYYFLVFISSWFSQLLMTWNIFLLIQHHYIHWPMSSVAKNGFK